MVDQNRNELRHYGVIGMRWGVRRYQPYSVKPRRSGKSGKEIGIARRVGRKAGNAITSPIKRAVVRRVEDREKAKAIKDRKQSMEDIRLLSDDEIQSRITRLKNEQELKRLTVQDVEPGKKYINSILSDSGRKVATTVLTGAAIYGVKYLIDNDFDKSEFARTVYRGGAPKK